MSLNQFNVSVSTQIVIRVFPRFGMTAPRFPLLKSYSSFISTFFILFPFMRACLPCGNQPDLFLIVIGINHDEYSAQQIRSNGYESLLTMPFILYGQCYWIIKYRRRMRKLDAM